MSKTNGAAQDDLGQILEESGTLPQSAGLEARVENLGRLAVSPEALRTLPADFVKRHRVLPFKIQNGTLHIATADPGNQRVIDDIRLLSGLEVQESAAASS